MMEAYKTTSNIRGLTLLKPLYCYSALLIYTGPLFCLSQYRIAGPGKRQEPPEYMTENHFTAGLVISHFIFCRQTAPDSTSLSDIASVESCERL